MIQSTRTARYIVAAVLLATLPFGMARAQGEDVSGLQGRYELWMGPTWWPALGDIQPGEGHFDSTGLALGFAFHFTTRQFEHSDLLIGFDMSVSGIDSDIGGFLSSVMARQLFLGLSAKWLTSPDRNVSLDAGIGYYETDMAEVSASIFGLENEIWSRSRAGAWAGIGWDVSRGRPTRKNGLFLAVKAHFVDFGNVHGDGLFTPGVSGVGGGSAGRLGGPIYVLEIGYSGR